MTAAVQNDRYAKHLMGVLNGLPKKVNAHAAIRAFRVALSNTVQDSGRAAYNWHLKISAAAPFKAGQWQQTSSRYSGIAGPGVVGAPGEKREQSAAAKSIVINYKLQAYGAGPTMRGHITHTSLYNKLASTDIGGKGRPLHVTLYNPIWQAKNPRYVDNAFDATRTRQAVEQAIRRDVRIVTQRLKRDMKLGKL